MAGAQADASKWSSKHPVMQGYRHHRSRATTSTRFYKHHGLRQIVFGPGTRAQMG